MRNIRSGLAALAAVCLAGTALAQSDDPLGVGRKMLAEDNPGELWIETGRSLYHQKRGPKGATLERCDFGMGPGKLEGAAARLPRYFADVDRVMDLETRLIHCMVTLQGFKEADVVRRAISPGGTW